MHTSPSQARSSGSSWPSAGLVLVAPGGVADQHAAQRLADLLQLRRLPLCPASAAANTVLAALAQEQPGWLLPLQADPAADREGEGCWVERLAAWRQPVLLLVPAAQVGAGPDRAYSAVMHQEAAPLLGLVQLAGAWQPERRRSDGLSWLGWLPESDGPAGSAEDLALQELRLQLRRCWGVIAARASAPAHPPA